jgi:hypothetical protein
MIQAWFYRSTAGVTVLGPGVTVPGYPMTRIVRSSALPMMSIDKLIMIDVRWANCHRSSA